MSEESIQAVSAAEEAHRYSGAVGIGEPSESVQLDRGHDTCVAYCLTPGQRRRGARCPSCYGKVAIRALDGDEIEPGFTRWAWVVGAFLGGWAAAWRDATVGMVRKPAAASDDGLPHLHHPYDARNGTDHAREGMT